MRIDGHPWLHAPSGSTTHPSRQQAGAVASNKAFRMKSSRVSGVNPSLAKASAAVMRYGFCFVVFIWFDRASIARQIPPLPMEPDGKSGFDEMTSTLSVGRNPHVCQSTPSTGAEKTHSARGSYCFGSAKGFGGLSLGANTES